jgi:hypothetical protein
MRYASEKWNLKSSNIRDERQEFLFLSFEGWTRQSVQYIPQP